MAVLVAAQVAAPAATEAGPNMSVFLGDGLLGALMLWAITRTFGLDKRRAADHDELIKRMEARKKEEDERYYELKMVLAKMDGRLDELANTLDDHSRRLDDNGNRLMAGLGQQDVARHNLRNEMAKLLGDAELRERDYMERVEKRVIANETRLNDIAERRTSPR